MNRKSGPRNFLCPPVKLAFLKAGMKPGDVLTQVNGQVVSDVVTLLNRIAQTSSGDEAKINLLRKRKQMTLKVQIGKQPKSKSAAR